MTSPTSALTSLAEFNILYTKHNYIKWLQRKCVRTCLLYAKETTSHTIYNTYRPTLIASVSFNCSLCSSITLPRSLYLFDKSEKVVLKILPS